MVTTIEKRTAGLPERLDAIEKRLPA